MYAIKELLDSNLFLASEGMDSPLKFSTVRT